MSLPKKIICSIFGIVLALAWYAFVSSCLFGFPLDFSSVRPSEVFAQPLAHECAGETVRSATVIEGELPAEYMADWNEPSQIEEADDARRLMNPLETQLPLKDRLNASLRTRTAAEKAVAAARLEAQGIVEADITEHERLVAIEVDKLRASKSKSSSNGYGTDGLMSYTAPASPTDSMSAGTISFLGTTNSYCDSYLSASAPSHGAGLWMGNDSTTDGDWGYFIGHNPGDFCQVMNLSAGDMVYVCDRAGNTRSYRVVDTFTIPDYTAWEDIQGRVVGYGESVILQTCCGDKANYRVVVAVG